jgi:hypothetical protein
VTDDGQPRLSFGLRFTGGESAADRHGHAEQIEKVRGHQQRDHCDRAFGATPIDLRLNLITGKAHEHAAAIEIPPLRVRHVTAVARAHENQRVGSCCGRGREQHLDSYVEDSGVGADGNRDRERSRRYEQRLATQGPDGVAEVLQHVVHERHAPGVAALLLDARNWAECATCGRSCVGRAHSRCHEFANLLVQVQFNLASQRVVEALSANERVPA